MLKNSGEKVFATAYAGIAGTLLIGGSSFHSQTNAPQGPTPDMVLGIEIHKNMQENNGIIYVCIW